jgi:nitrate/nitrite transporter NarK
LGRKGLKIQGYDPFSTCVDVGGCRAGTVAGSMNFAGQTGAFFLAVVFGKIADMPHNYNTPVLLIAAILILESIAWLGIDPTKRVDELVSDIEAPAVSGMIT